MSYEEGAMRKGLTELMPFHYANDPFQASPVDA